MKFLTALFVLLTLVALGIFLASPLFVGVPARAVVGVLKLVNPQAPSRASCTIAAVSDTSGTSTITGSGFTSSTTCQVKIGDRVTVGTETKTATAVGDTSITTDTSFLNTNSSVTMTVLPALLTVADSTGAIKMVVNDQGNIGVGNNPPAARLDVTSGGSSSLIQNSSGNLTITPASNLIVSQGNVGIGDTSPGVKLSVSGVLSGPSTQNLRLQATGATAGNGGNGSIYFLDSTGTTRARIDTATLAGGANYATFYMGASNTSASDLAEYYVTGDPTLSAGDVVSVSNIKLLDSGGQEVVNKGVLRKSNLPYDPHLIGVISTNPGVIMGSIDLPADATHQALQAGGDTGKKDKRILSLAGRTPVKIAPDSPALAIGDFLTASATFPGMATKATQAGYTVARALENWSCRLSAVSCQLTIEGFVTLSYFDPDLSLADTGNLSITNDSQGGFVVKNQGSTVSRLGAFAELVVARLQAGLIETQKLVISGGDVLGQLNDLNLKVVEQQHQINELKAELENLKKP